MAKRIYTRHETDEQKQKRRLEFETLQTQRILRETAELNLQVLQRASFQSTPEHIQILQQVAKDGGRTNAAELLTNDSRKGITHELRHLGYLQWYGDAGLLDGFEVTDEGRKLIASSQVHPDDTPPRRGPKPDPDAEQIVARYIAGERDYYAIIENLQLKTKWQGRLPYARVKNAIAAHKKRLKQKKSV